MKRALKTIARSVGVTRPRVAAARMCCERHWLATFGRPSKRYVGRILCYHTIGQSEWGVNDVTPAQFRRQIVAYHGSEAAGTVIIDTPNTFLYLVMGNGRALRYGIGVGRDGFRWSGVQQITKKAEWPDWTPPAEMIQRQPYLPRFMAGGATNPLGARAMYLGNTVYRIHGTNAPSTIGQRVSSGCIRLTNEDVIDLASRVNIGTKVVVINHDYRAEQPARPMISAPASMQLR